MSTRPPRSALRPRRSGGRLCDRRDHARGLQRKNAYVPPPPPKVHVAQPVQKPVTLYLDLTGNTAPFNSVDLVARVQGYLESIDYKDGASATKGTQLFGIERDLYQAQLDQAKATLASDQATEAYNEAEYERQATLARQDFASQATLEQWKSKRRPGRGRRS